MSQDTLKRVFLVGCPRSGTTLLQSLLAANARIISFPESHFYEKLFSSRSLLSALSIASSKARPRWNLFLEEIKHPEMQSILPKYAIFVHQFSKAFIHVLDNLAYYQGKSVWIEKTPGHLRRVDQIEKLVKNARFVHILRNGEDNIASLFEMGTKYPVTWGRWYGTLDQCIQRWVTDILISKQHASRVNHYLVKYEKLIENPKTVLCDLCEFIGVPFEGKMLLNYPKSADQLILEREPWKTSVYEPIWTVSRHKFYNFLNSEQRDYILAHLPNNLSD